MNKQDHNEVHLAGSVDRIKEIKTKTGSAMCEIILQVKSDKIRTTAFGNIASHLLLACGPGDRLSITGTLSVRNWKDENTGSWKTSTEVKCWACEIHGNKIEYQRDAAPTQAPTRARDAGVPVAQPGDFF